MDLSRLVSSCRQNDALQKWLLATLTASVCLSYLIGILLTSGIEGRIIQGDAAAYFSYLPSVVLDRDLDLRNQFETLGLGEGEPKRLFGGSETLARKPFPIGAAILWLPGYIVGLVPDWILWKLGVSGRSVGYGPGVTLGTAAWCILIAGLGAEATRRLVRRPLGIECALPSAVMIWLGTPCLYYTLVSPLYSHAIAWCAASLMIWAAWRATQLRSEWTAWGTVGVLSGIVLAIRLQDAPLLLIPLALIACSTRPQDDIGRTVRFTAAWSGGLFLGFPPQASTSLWLNGRVMPVGDASLSLPSLLDAFSVLFSTGYQGWISWTPLVLPSVVGLGLLTQRSHSRDIRTLAGGCLP